MKTEALIVAILLVGSALPLATARHVSIGYEDSPGMSVDETPNDPTVPDGAHERGVETNCPEIQGELDAGDLQKAATADAFCGELVYHANSGLEQVSPTDQDHTVPEIGDFDIQVVNYAGTALEDWCQPFCGPGGDVAWDAFHTAGSEADLTHGPSTADQNENDDRDQIYYAAASLPNSGRVLQEQTGAWEMNGFYPLVPYQAFAGFLYDANGVPIDEDRLRTLISKYNLGSEAIPKVCGWTPEGDFEGTAATGPCEINLVFRGPSDSQDFRGDYDYECDSPTYVCGAAAGGMWYGRIQCPATCGPNSETDYRIYHWVVAPQLDQDCKAREPGFEFDTPQGAPGPYLAHDLDVYSPTASVVENGRSVPTTIGWADSVADDATEPVDDLLNNLPGVPDTDEATASVSKDSRVEPNALPAGSLEETSQSLEGDADLQRSLDECSALTSSETPETADQWIDIVDGEALLGTRGQRSGTGQEAQVFFYDGRGFGDGNTGLYGTTDQEQDSSNRPGPASIWTQGKVGMFTDKDDDGEYDQVDWNEKFGAENIEADGNYPLMWDMRVDENGDIDPNKGCTRLGGESFPEIMLDAGYGPHTGIAQLVYLNEPTAFYDPVTGQTTPYPGGNNIHVLASQAVKQLWTPDTGDNVNPLDTNLDGAIADLQSYAQNNNGHGDVPDVRTPGTELGRDSDFQPACEEPGGGFTSGLAFVHDCSVDCSGDTIVTAYNFEVARTDGSLGGGGQDVTMPAFTPEAADGTYDFGSGVHQWIDVDPFDGDPDRNTDASSAPPTGD